MTFYRYSHAVFIALSLFALMPGSASAVTFADDVAPIINRHCIECHRPGLGTPFTFMNFAEVSAKAKMIARVTEDGTMPPWKPERGHVPLRGERGLSDAEKATLRQWVQEGAPEGDPARTPPLPTFPESGWRLGTPDLVVQMTEPYDVPADGPDVYRNFVIPLPALPEGKWLKGVEFRAGAPTVVHHCLLDLDHEGRARVHDAEDPGPGFEAMDQLFEDTRIAAFAVGGLPFFFPEGIAYAIPEGTDLILETHFHPSGKPEREVSSVGLYFTDQPPTRELVNLQIPPSFGLTTAFRIPAGEENYVLEHSYTLSHDVEVKHFFPHAHYLCKEIRCDAVLPTGEKKTLLSIKHWDFAWQEQYSTAELLVLPAGTELKMRWVYDNSANNPFNPTHPPREVRWGQQTTDEMASLGVAVIPVRREDTEPLKEALLKYTKQQYRDMPEEYLAGVVGPEIMRRFDKNKDGFLSIGDVKAMGSYWRMASDLHRGHPSFEIERIIERRGALPFLKAHFMRTAKILGTLALIVLVLLIASIVWWWRRRRRRKFAAA